ncbi:MAG TPA: membrane dipeptidase [Cyclobacteriaceae bacterium]|nr:membrane dipeptidase [Cyclobacteriaceae bacterium]
MLSVDAHLDLSMNATEWNRDLRMPISEIREREKDLNDKPDRGKNTVTFDELRKGNFGLVVATQIARYVERGSSLPGWNSPEQAWAHTQAQIAWYKSMEECGEMKQITDLAALEKHITDWEKDKSAIGYILSLEGADSIVTLKHLERAYQYGLRALGPAHYGPGRYAFGTDSNGPMGPKGKALLKEMERLNIILDATHLCDESFREAMDTFNGPVWASHHNCRALVNHNRQFSDDQLKELISRGAVIGAPMDAWMIVPGWVRGKSTPQGMGVNLERVVDHMDHICQLAGNANHIGIGSDLDGAFGKEQCPYDIDTIADLQKLGGILAKRGYKAGEIENVMSGNWLRFLKKAWKA